MNVHSFGTIKIPILGFPLRNPRENWHVDVVPVERHKVYYKEGNGASFQRLQVM
jgi:hypothetical protein